MEEIKVPDELVVKAIKFIGDRGFELEDVPQLLCEFALEYHSEQTKLIDKELQHLRQYKKETEEMLNDPVRLGEYIAGM